MKEWTTPDFRNTPSTTNIEEEEIVDAPGNDDNASIPEQIKRPKSMEEDDDDYYDDDDNKNRERKATCIGHIQRRNWLLKHFTEGKIEESVEVTGRRGSIPQRLLDDIKERW